METFARIGLFCFLFLNVMVAWRNWKVRFKKNQTYLNYIHQLVTRNKKRMSDQAYHRSIDRLVIINAIINLSIALLLQTTWVTVLCLIMTCLEAGEYLFYYWEYPKELHQFTLKDYLVFYFDRFLSSFCLFYYPLMVMAITIIH